MKSGLLLDIVITEGPTVFKTLSSEDQSLLVGRDALLVLDLGLHILDGIGPLDIEGKCLARKGLNENLH